MKYKLVALIILLSSIIYVSCSNDSSDGIDEDWKTYNEKIVTKASTSGEYKELKSNSKNGSVYWKNVTDFIPNDNSAISTKITEDGKPYFTDTVTVRYTGWYIKSDSTKYIFDTTEGDYNGVSRTFRVGSMVDGFATILQNMTVGQQVEVCIPQRLGYGSTAQTYIPAYTTLWFRVKLLKITPGNPNEWK